MAKKVNPPTKKFNPPTKRRKLEAEFHKMINHPATYKTLEQRSNRSQRKLSSICNNVGKLAKEIENEERQKETDAG